MKSLFRIAGIIVAIALSSIANAAPAGTVVTIDSLANRTPLDQYVNFPTGAPYGYPFDPNKYLNQVLLTLAPGTYAFTFVGGAWNPWGQDNNCGAAPSASCAGWVSSVSFDTGPGSTISDLGTSALRWSTPAGALAGAQALPVFTQSFAAKTTLRFFIQDYPYDEIGPYWVNQGAVSLNVAAIPEPETYAMLLAGLALLGVKVRRGR